MGYTLRSREIRRFRSEGSQRQDKIEKANIKSQYPRD